MREPKFCRWCGHALAPQVIEGATLGVCTGEGCKLPDYDNPIPVVALIIPEGDGIILVKRGVPPFVGEWCLPCGYVNKNTGAKQAAVGEALQECGKIVRLVSVPNICLPHAPGITLNQNVIFFLARPIGGELKAGDDALEAQVFRRGELPKICFGSHELAVNDWFDGNLGTLEEPRLTVDRKAVEARRQQVSRCTK